MMRPTTPDLTAEQRAFQRGAQTTNPKAVNPYSEKRARASWVAGRRFGEHQRQGLRPLDTAKVVASK